MAEFITKNFLKKIATEGRLIEAINLLDRMSDDEKANLPKLSNLSSWECVLEEVLDTDHEPKYYTRFVNELFRRGYTKDDIMVMRMVAWETAGWLNFEMLVWDWCCLSESDMHEGLLDRRKKKNISKRRYQELSRLIERYKNAPKRRNQDEASYENSAQQKKSNNF